ncbi:MAG: hypothetical protein IJ324_02815 [Lachnospiraceae bacterium]|nr:hypothetical protein [Lachnospiraceae bacterium]
MDLEKIKAISDEEQIRAAKQWLFSEYVRISSEASELAQMKDKFNKERATYTQEMNALNHRMVMEQKRLREEHMFFDKKLAILQQGFKELEEDRRRLEQERKQLKYAQADQNYNSGGTVRIQDAEDFVALLFRNINNPLTLQKRYRDLVKIYHPDNFCGDEQLIQLINKEFKRRKDEM